jgi:hypothetical protein
MSTKEIQAAINQKQAEYDELDRKFTYLNEADNPYSSGKDRAEKASRLGHLNTSMKALKAEIEKLEQQLG